MLKEIINTLGITPTQIRIFIFSFVAVTVMATLQNLGISSPIHLF